MELIFITNALQRSLHLYWRLPLLQSTTRKFSFAVQDVRNAFLVKPDSLVATRAAPGKGSADVSIAHKLSTHGATACRLDRGRKRAGRPRAPAGWGHAATAHP